MIGILSIVIWVHELVHVGQALIIGGQIKQFCAAGYSVNEGVPAIGWVTGEIPVNKVKDSEYFEAEATFISIVVAVILLWIVLKEEVKR